MAKQVESSGNMARPEFGICSLGVGIAEHSIQVVIPPGVLLVRRVIISKFVLGTLTTKTARLLKMMLVAILCGICKPCCETRCPTHEVATCTGNIVTTTFGAGMLFNGERLEYPLEYLIQHLSVCKPLPI
jgi:hypothetical protein